MFGIRSFNRRFRAFLCLALFGTACLQGHAFQQLPDTGWPVYGGTLAGQRYSPATKITRGNVTKLQPVWTLHTHALDQPSSQNRRAHFEATPVLWRGTLFVSSPFDQVFALDAATGAPRWSFDPDVRKQESFNVTSRGVALWHATKPQGGLCGSDAVLIGTLDRRLIELDANSGKLCPRFGRGGVVDLTQGVEIAQRRLYSVTSPPVILGNVVVVGSLIGDNQDAFAASGAVRGFDAITGRQLWAWEPLPWAMAKQPHVAGSGNAWAPMSADPEHDLVFVPTGSASTDFFGGLRPGDNRDANSIVALQASTGRKVWAFQLVHHDLWDYDTPSQPLLFTFRGALPAVAVVTKTNMVFVFNRLTGEPLYPVHEQPVPASTLTGEHASPTQPYSSLPMLGPTRLTAADLHLHRPADQAYCVEALRHLENKGMFTPPSAQGTLIFPGDLGGANWGSAAFDPQTSVLYVRTSNLSFTARELKRPRVGADWLTRVKWHIERSLPSWAGGAPQPEGNEFKIPDSGGEQREHSFQQGTPYHLIRRVLLAPDGVPCAPEPFGSLVAISLDTGKKLWSVPHGEMAAGESGSYGMGGAIVTAGGLVFLASSNDAFLRAYDSSSGQEVWRHRLPAVGEATPMTYVLHGRQFVVVAAGGHGFLGSHLDDSLVAFALPLSSAASRHR